MTNEKTEKLPDWKELEHLVMMIQKQLSPDAIVRHDVKLDGVDSETKRQVDVLVEQNIGQYTMRIVIDCKDYSKPIDVKGIEEFNGLVQDVRAHKGALVCPSGFTKAALKRAKKLQMDLYRPVSTGKHKWQAEVTAPILCDFRSCYMSFGLSCSGPKPLKIQQDFYNLPVLDGNGSYLGSALNTASNKWNEGLYPSQLGEHERFSVFGNTKVFIDNGYDDTVEVDLTIQLHINRNLYLGHLAVDDINGLQDEHSGAIVTNAFTLGGINPEEVEKSWKKIEDPNEIDCQPLLKVIGYYCYGVGT